VQFLAGDVIRHCLDTRYITGPYQPEDIPQLQAYLLGRQWNEAVLNFCKDKDLCNGSGRLAEISTMMILLPASLVLLISFFSRH